MKWLTSFLLWSYLGLVQAQTHLTLYQGAEIELYASYDSPLRLSQALIELKPSADTYWLAATFGELNQRKALEQKRVQLLTRLEQLALVWGEQQQRAESVRRFMSELEQLHFVPKTFYSADLDRVRLGLVKDPQLKGEVVFYFPSRPSDIRVIGAVTSLKTFSYQAGKYLSDYVNRQTMLRPVENGKIYVIQPDGSVEQANLGYWLKPSNQVAPGATLYLGFSSLPEEFAMLNDDIAELLRYQGSWWEF